jgi:acetamidase/formamidase
VLLREYRSGKERENEGGAAAMAQTHYFPEDKVHHVWDDELDPIITNAPGDTVVYHTRDVTDGQITPNSTADAITTLDWSRPTCRSRSSGSLLAKEGAVLLQVAVG